MKEDLTVRPVLSSKHRSKEIPYKDFVVVTRVHAKMKSKIPSQRSIQSSVSCLDRKYQSNSILYPLTIPAS